jgi:xanthine dehydrogenase accessory factor
MMGAGDERGRGGGDVFEALARARRERQLVVLATVVEVAGSTPQAPGAKLLLLAGGRAIGTVGGGAIEPQVLEAAGAMLAPGGPAQRLAAYDLSRDLGMCCGGQMKVFLERIEPAARLLVFGAGHVGAAICEAAARAGFEVTVVDEREEWADAGRLASARTVLCGEPAAMVPELAPDPATACVVATHSHAVDQATVKALLGTPAGFVGMIGSRRKRDKFHMRLRAQGIGEQQLARLRTPLGLDIGAVTPEEIAVSVVAELVAVRRGRAVERTGRPEERSA